MIRDYSKRPPAAVQRYATRHHLAAEQPRTIVEQFRKGWQPAAAGTHVTAHTARQLRHAGVTCIAVDMGGGRRADFNTADLING